MQLAERTLLDRLHQATAAKHAGIPPDELLRYMSESADWIDYLNEPRHLAPDGKRKPIIHRDVNPC
jgi:hypothetical protein